MQRDALVPNKAGGVAEFGYTIAEAINRAGSEWVAINDSQGRAGVEDEAAAA